MSEGYGGIGSGWDIFGVYNDIWDLGDNGDNNKNTAGNADPSAGASSGNGSVTEEDAGPVEEGNTFWERAAAMLGVGLDYIKANPWMQQLIRQAGIRIFDDKPSFDWDRFKQAQIDTTVMRSPDYFNQFGNSQVMVDPETGKKTVTGEMAPWLTDMVNAMVSRSASPMNAYQKPEAFNDILGEYIGDREDYFGIPRSGSTTQQHNVGGYGSPVNIDIGGPMSPKAPGVDPTDDGSAPDGSDLGNTDPGDTGVGQGEQVGTGVGQNQPGYQDRENEQWIDDWNTYENQFRDAGMSDRHINSLRTLYGQGIQGEGAYEFVQHWKNILGGAFAAASGNIVRLLTNIGKGIKDHFGHDPWETVPVDPSEVGEYDTDQPIYDEPNAPWTSPGYDAGEYQSGYGDQPGLPGNHPFIPDPSQDQPPDFWNPGGTGFGGDQGLPDPVTGGPGVGGNYGSAPVGGNTPFYGSSSGAFTTPGSRITTYLVNGRRVSANEYADWVAAQKDS